VLNRKFLERVPGRRSGKVDERERKSTRISKQILVARGKWRRKGR
jgi:hypothetical protein